MERSATVVTHGLVPKGDYHEVNLPPVPIRSLFLFSLLPFSLAEPQSWHLATCQVDPAVLCQFMTSDAPWNLLY